MLSAAQTVAMPMEENAEANVSPFDDIAQVHALHEARIFRFLLFSLRDRDVALSLTQDTFLKAWRTRASFRGDCSVPTWLMRIAVSLLRSHTRTESVRFWKKAATQSVDISEIELACRRGSAESRMVTREQLAAIWDTVEALPGRQKAIFLLRFVDEMELPEIAAAMDLALPTVKSHLYRALDAVRARNAAQTARTRKEQP